MRYDPWLIVSFSTQVLAHVIYTLFFFSSRRRHTRFDCDWSSDVCSSDLVAAVELGYSRPFYVFADGNTIPPANWLWVESRGGRGGAGTAGQNGSDGAAGQGGCPPQPGGPGGSGGNGAPGGSGGRGGRVTIIVPTENPFLAGLIEARSPGGQGGPGG